MAILCCSLAFSSPVVCSWILRLRQFYHLNALLEKHHFSRRRKIPDFLLWLFLYKWVKNLSQKILREDKSTNWLFYPNRLSWFTPSFLLSGTKHIQMKLKLQDLNFSLRLFIYKHYGSLYPPGVAEDGELCWGICREHPSPGRQGWQERQELLFASCLELLSVEGQEQLRQVMGIVVLHCH